MAAYRPVHEKTPVPASPAEVQHAIAEIKQFHKIGCVSLAAFPRGKVYGRMTKEAAKVKLHPETLRKARVLADPKAGYSQAALAELCALIRKHKVRHSFAFGPTHLVRLLSIKDKRQRREVQAQAVKGGWSLERLNAEIRMRFGKRKKTGRKAKAPATADEAGYELLRLCERWQRVCASLHRPRKDGTQVHTELSPKVREGIEKVEEAMERLRNHLLRRVPE